MHRFTKIAALLVVSSMLAACGGHSGAIPSQSQSGGMSDRSMSSAHPGVPLSVINHWTPIYTVLPPRNVDFASLNDQQAAGTTIPFFTGSIKSPLDGHTYTYSIAGKDPHTTPRTTTDLVYVPIVVRMHFSGGVVLDPTQPGCGDTVSVQDRFFKGPNFVPTPLISNGVHVGKVQVNDGDQRAQWWSLVKNTGYHLFLKASGTPIVVDVTAPAGSSTAGGVCAGASHDLGEIPINGYDSIVQGLATKYAKTNQVPLVLTYNVVETSGGCCIIGYHSAFGRSGGTQVYSVGAYMDPGFFSVPIEDIHAWTHEIGELMNDPFINNATPAWGHVGQVSGCQNNLEVGDPLTGVPYLLTYNGFTYHPQELAFFDWFFRTPAEGTHKYFSFEGSFKTSQGACA